MLSTYEALERYLSEKISHQTIQINTIPFPHFVIDDFLPVDIFKQINSSSPSGVSLRKEFFTPVEKNKKIWGDEELSGSLLFPVKLLGGAICKKLVSKIISSQSVKSMMDMDNYGGYYPYHSMQVGGFLGSHVDHSYAMNDDDLHVANCIYFVSPKWDETWGGETLLFNQTGFQIIKKILPKPNRLVVFSHSSSSFHGTGTLKCPDSVKRNTYYMDFYIPNSEYYTVRGALKKAFGTNFSIWRHGTTFIPFAPLGIKSFSLKNFLSRIRYFPSFLLYWLIFFFRPLGVFNKSRIR